MGYSKRPRGSILGYERKGRFNIYLRGAVPKSAEKVLLRVPADQRLPIGVKVLERHKTGGKEWLYIDVPRTLLPVFDLPEISGQLEAEREEMARGEWSPQPKRRPPGKTAQRNLQIKKALSQRFGSKNVRVKGERGTAYGWVDITIKAEKPHKGDCDWRCEQCENKRWEVKREAWRILQETGLDKQLGHYYDDYGEKRPECTIEVKLE
ncbi:MAG: hypothetical protein QXD04_05570 [Candidatus Bathyarchaeia archaeon]